MFKFFAGNLHHFSNGCNCATCPAFMFSYPSCQKGKLLLRFNWGLLEWYHNRHLAIFIVGPSLLSSFLLPEMDCLLTTIFLIHYMAIVMKFKLTIPLVRNKNSFVPLMIAQEPIVLITFSADISQSHTMSCYNLLGSFARKVENFVHLNLRFFFSYNLRLNCNPFHVCPGN